METAIKLITIERQEQIQKHGFSAKHDLVFNNERQLLGAAEYLINKDRNRFPYDLLVMKKLDGKERIEQLVIAAALIAAEIDRLIELKEYPYKYT